MTHIFITREIPEKGVRLLHDAGYDVTVSEKDDVLTSEELLTALKEKPYDAVLSTLSDKFTEEVIGTIPSVRIIANYAVGFDNINIPEAKKHNVVITNTPDVLTDAVAEHTVALLFALAKRIPETDRFTRAGKYTGWGPLLLLGVQLNGKTLGLIGTGRIGSRVAEMAVCMGLRIIYFDINRNTKLEEKVGAIYHATIDGVLKQSDIVSLHVPLLDSTRHLINEQSLSMMKKTAFLVNTSRGPVVDEAALVSALQNKTIRGAALDVFENEPTLAPGLAELESTILTPHTASGTEETRDAMSEMAAQSIIDFFEGKTPKHVVF